MKADVLIEGEIIGEVYFGNNEDGLTMASRFHGETATIANMSNACFLCNRSGLIDDSMFWGTTDPYSDRPLCAECTPRVALIKGDPDRTKIDQLVDEAAAQGKEWIIEYPFPPDDPNPFALVYPADREKRQKALQPIYELQVKLAIKYLDDMKQLGINADKAVEMLEQTGSQTAALALAKEISSKSVDHDNV
jgi:hypothetical protein